MLKYELTYEDFNGEKVTETFYFNISKTELVELDVEHKEGMDQWLKNMVNSDDKKVLFAEFKRILLLAYGQKSPDGKRFVKSDQMREEFSQSAGFEEMFVQLMSSEDKVANFIKGALPKDLSAEVEKVQEAEKKEAEKKESEKAIEAKQDSPPIPTNS